MAISAEMQVIVEIVRTRLDDLSIDSPEFDDDYLSRHIQNNLDTYNWELPLEMKRDNQLIAIEALIDIITAVKAWADGESYSYKNDAIQVTRGLMSKHYKDTIDLLKEERNELIGMDGGFA
ncbi:hypothetical protein [Priestia megaterium]|uniref:hypothetical protein n=1 Tax=Priestia megaterium TaxID=1404 RepID=UPI00211C01E5|nr:hypothetical protein [Priestia megaterium]